MPSRQWETITLPPLLGKRCCNINADYFIPPTKRFKNFHNIEETIIDRIQVEIEANNQNTKYIEFLKELRVSFHVIKTVGNKLTVEEQNRMLANAIFVCYQQPNDFLEKCGKFITDNQQLIKSYIGRNMLFSRKALKYADSFVSNILN